MALSTNNHRTNARSGRGARPQAGGRTTQERKPLQRRDTGYRVGRGKAGSHRDGLSGLVRDPRMLVIGLVGLVVLGVLIFGVSSCVRSCTASSKKQQQDKQAEEKVNAFDSRVAADASEEVTTKLAEVLDLSEAYEDIAKHADAIDPKLIDLAIAEPEAVPFVRAAPGAKAATSPYTETVNKGQVPMLYTWDGRWGYASYAEGLVATSGSGPLALSMASMGLNGSTKNDPATVINAVTAAKLATSTTGMDDTFVTSHAGEVDLVAEPLELTTDGIYNAFYNSSIVLARLKADSPIGSEEAHWALITALNEDGSYTVRDPTSAVASSHAWAGGTIVKSSEAFYMLSSKSGGSDEGTASTSQDDSSGSGEIDYSSDEYVIDENTRYDAEGNPIFN